MKQDMKDAIFSKIQMIYTSVLSALNGDRASIDEETESLRTEMKKEFIKMRERGLPIRIVTL